MARIRRQNVQRSRKSGGKESWLRVCPLTRWRSTGMMLFVGTEQMFWDGEEEDEDPVSKIPLPLQQDPERVRALGNHFSNWPEQVEKELSLCHPGEVAAWALDGSIVIAVADTLELLQLILTRKYGLDMSDVVIDTIEPDGDEDQERGHWGVV